LPARRSRTSVYAGDENHLVGYTGLPEVLNPYFKSFGESRPVAGAVLPGAGSTTSCSTRVRLRRRPVPIPFLGERHATSRSSNSSRPSRARCALRRRHGRGRRSALGVGNDRRARRHATFDDGRVTVRASPGSHELVVSVSDYQELKNMDDVAKIKANTATLTQHSRSQLVVLVDRRQRSEVTLDRSCEVVVVGRPARRHAGAISGRVRGRARGRRRSFATRGHRPRREARRRQ